jgi:hypothetical protein
MDVILSGVAVVSFFAILVYVAQRSTRIQKEKNINALLDRINPLIAELLFSETDRDRIINCVRNDKMSMFEANKEIENIVSVRERLKYLINKYGYDVAEKLVKHEYFIGMTEEQLIDCKGKPNKIDTETLKTKTKATYIYGNKASGDYFVFENGIAIKIVDR